jgi:hypothetical protein
MLRLLNLSFVLVLVQVSFTSAQVTVCGQKELEAALPSNAQAYPEAIALSQTLSKHGILVKCVLLSKMENTFDGQDGAALYRTDNGDFEVLFLPQPKTFDRLNVIERQDGARYSYRFKGPPQPWPANLIDSSFRIYFIKNRNMLFVVENNKQLAAKLGKLVRSAPD